MDKNNTEIRDEVAEILNDIGWRSTSDAQWSRLQEAIPRLQVALSQPAQSAVVPQWISVKDSLPDYGVEVLLYRPNAYLSNDPEHTIRARRIGSRGPDEFECVATPTHWMPLPAAPSVSASQTAGPISEQNARFAINEAIERGKQGVNPPPTDSHWLMPFWKIGRQLADAAQIRNAAYEQCAALCADERFVYGDEEWKTRQLLAEGIIALKSSPQVAQEPAQAQVVATNDGRICFSTGWHVCPESAVAASPVLTQPSEKDDGERAFNAKRLRYVANLLGLKDAVPDDDQILLGCLGSVLGIMARKIERLQKSVSTEQQASELDKLDAQLWACNQETGKEFLIKSGTLSEMMAEMERMNAQGHDYFIRSAARAAQEKA